MPSRSACSASSVSSPRCGRGGLDLGHREPQFLRLAGALLARGHQRVELARWSPCQRWKGGAVLGEHRGQFGAGEPVERVTLRAGRAQPHLVGLAVHHHEVLAEFGEHADRGAAAADDGAAAAVRRRWCGRASATPCGRRDRVQLAAGILRPVRPTIPSAVDLPLPLDGGGSAARAAAPSCPRGRRAAGRAR